MALKIKKNENFGFTLIELLVVISIIGLLASVVLVSLNSARAKARDAKRKADFKQISTALEFYYDKYGKYPVSITGGTGGQCPSVHTGPCGYDRWGWCRDAVNCDGTETPAVDPHINWIPGLQEFIKLPHNPKPYAQNGDDYQYYSYNGVGYWLMVSLEDRNDKNTCSGGADPIWFDNTTHVCTAWWSGTSLYSVFAR